MYILVNIDWAIGQVSLRIKSIKGYQVFITTNSGIEKLDSVCMQLINIGEALKQIDKISEYSLLSKYKEIDWKSAKGMKDMITHHYFDVDAETVYNVCKNQLPEMGRVIKKIIEDLNNAT